MYKRAEYQTITNRLKEPRKFIQVVMGPRQIGKSTVVKQVLQDLDVPCQFFSADNARKRTDRCVRSVLGCRNQSGNMSKQKSVCHGAT